MGALILDRCRAFDLFASVDAHLWLWVHDYREWVRVKKRIEKQRPELCRGQQVSKTKRLLDQLRCKRIVFAQKKRKNGKTEIGIMALGRGIMALHTLKKRAPVVNSRPPMHTANWLIPCRRRHL